MSGLQGYCNSVIHVCQISKTKIFMVDMFVLKFSDLDFSYELDIAFP